MSVSQECPDKLFMYFRKENFKKFLTNHSLKFSDLTKVNDPFELKIDFKKSMIDTGFRDTYNSESLNDKDIELLQDGQTDNLKHYGVACFTETDTNVLMWAYYGEGQQGVCVEFDTSEDKLFFKETYKVQYKGHFESIKKVVDSFDYIDVLTTKSLDWKHEREWRVIKLNYANQLLPINPRAIKSIILGANLMDYRGINEELSKTYTQIFDLLKRPEYSHVMIKQIQIDQTEYKIHSNEVPFIVYSAGENIVIISLKEQCAEIKDVMTDELIYSANMFKWEKLTIPKPRNAYLLYDPSEESGCIRIRNVE